MSSLLDLHLHFNRKLVCADLKMEKEEIRSVEPDPENKILLEPYEYIRTLPGKQVRPKLIKVRPSKVKSINDPFPSGVQYLASYP